MALLKRIHTEATRLGGITANLSASELDTIEDYGVQLWNIASDLLLSFAPNVNPLLLEACTTCT
ncbi:hypothetical protein LRAMOSA09567 [Lichtheimia ramosa]|uniref:Uncharacterized protein n=1 Tax=Lichtheimia ramosa TaxID=688394 RepID=A0A077WIS7_9FUNG|nr:hypothetical protein LRAMOSA09567 [Lichtheimia ramosa]